MKIPGEDLRGSWAATEFVAWYNGHPDFHDLAIDLSTHRAVVVGNGNVAIDVARMLALSIDELAKTDIADHALEVLRESEVEEIVLLGRRGPLQAAFTTPELLELGELSDADVTVDPDELELDEHSERALGEAGGTQRRNLEVLRELAERKSRGKKRRIVLRFLASPVALRGTDGVTAVELVRNELRRTPDGALVARPTEQRELQEAGLVFRSIGYRGTPIDGVPFDTDTGTIPNAAGRVLDPDTDEVRAGEYVAGWIKRGPSGVIGTNKRDAQQTVDALLDDLAAGHLRPANDLQPGGIQALLDQRGLRWVDYSGWETIDAAECEAGTPHGRPRVKLCSFDALLGVTSSVRNS